MVLFGIRVKPNGEVSQLGEDRGGWVGGQQGGRAVAVGMEAPHRVLEG